MNDKSKSTIIDENSCRICLSPNSAFANVFGTFQKRKVCEIILQVCKVKVNKNKNLPQSICEHCLSHLLFAESIKKLCTRNEKFLVDLAAAKYLPTEGTPIVKLEVKDPEADSIDEIDFDNLPEMMERAITPVDLDIEHSSVPSHSPAQSPVAFDWEPLIELNKQSKEKKRPKTNFYCSFCFKEFNTRAKCIYHEKMKHLPKPANADEKHITCDRCGMKFKHRSHIINHLNVVHLRIKRYQCNVCGFRMYSKTHHANHMISHSNVREFKCQQCDKDFSRKEALIVHQRTHTNERPYKCKYCERCYTAHTDLKKHIFSHTQVHPYICQLCNGGFFLKRLLFDHVNVAHAGIDTSMWLTGKTFHNF